MKILPFVASLLLFAFCEGFARGELVVNNSSICAKHKLCGNCIAAGCHWCNQQNYLLHRCNVKEELYKSGCDHQFITWSQSSIHYHNNTPPRNAEDDLEAVQLAPQNISIRLRPNEPYTFQVTFRQAENYPVDLYFLMDVSKTMHQFKETLKNMSNILATELRKLTKNYRLGLGTFVDKTTMPYVHHQYQLTEDDDAPFSFKNRQQLTQDISEFRGKVSAIELYPNLDLAEGVLDAVMQVITCTNDVGWRNQSRKMIVVSTDAEFHIAGDGLLGGVIESNREQCYLNAKGEYVESINEDYPSVSQIRRTVADKKMNLIFAIPENSKYEANAAYMQLVQHIEGSSYGSLSSNCSNIVDIIKDNYQRISSTVQMKSEYNDFIAVSFRSKCLNPETYDGVKDTDVCEGLHIGENVTFDVTIEAKIQGCPADRNEWTKVFNIYPAGLTEKLTVTVHLDCECLCETPHNKEYNSTVCNQNGTYECGLCTCNRDFYGSRCECSRRLDLTNCQKRGGDGTVCSGHGQCNCGRCICDPVSAAETSKRYTGNLCECNDYTCEYYNGKLCGGSTNGACKCGKCICKKGWTGRRCDCSTDVSKCRSKLGSICNNMGNCICNECQCDVDQTFFSGPTCDDCPTCTSTCEQYSECAKCVQSGDHTCSPACSRMQLVDTYESMPLESNETSCEVSLSNGCIVRFTWSAGTVVVQRNPICPPGSSDVIWIVLAVTGCIVAVGLILLCSWKLFITIHDRREYASFENEVKARREMITNPLYKDAVITCRNPAFYPHNQ